MFTDNLNVVFLLRWEPLAAEAALIYKAVFRITGHERNINIASAQKQ